MRLASSRQMRKRHRDQVSKYYWEPYFWSLSYFIGTVSDRTKQAVEAYIRNQKQ
ncbi:hypothetical protein B5G33_09900 [Blautia sp. An81]|nr:hypothetical protein B5G33_09900 [Blautia sp. An81]